MPEENKNNDVHKEEILDIDLDMILDDDINYIMGEARPLEEPIDPVKEAVSWIFTIVFALVVAFFINRFVLINANIPTASMENTIMSHSRVLAFRWAYTFGDPKRGDIIIFNYPDNPETPYVKRIIGLPGETVEIIDGLVYIDGANEPLDEPYLKEAPLERSYGPYAVPENCYFMLGDNRNNSADAREWNNTYLERNEILGEVFLKYYPRVEIMLNK